MTNSSRRFAVRTLCALMCAAVLFFALLVGGRAPSASAATYPTQQQRTYYCPNEGTFVSFNWTKPMPYGGWLGQALDTQRTVDVQAYDARPLSGGGLNWGFQAQDGSFVCRMYVSADQYNISFVNCRNANWPVTSCFAL